MSSLAHYITTQDGQFRRARLPSLYSDFLPQRNSNPDGFAVNCGAWIDFLSRAAWAGLIPASSRGHDTLTLKTGEDLLRALETKEWGRPLALGAVIGEAISQRKLIPLDDFLSSSRNIYAHTWATSPWRLWSWGMQQIGMVGDHAASPKMPTGRFVIVQNVEHAAAIIVDSLGDRTNPIDRTYPMAMFKGKVDKAMGLKGGMTDTDLSVVLMHLARDRAAIAYDRHTVKFKDPGDVPPRLTSQDSTVASLKGLIVDLQEQVASLSTRIAALSAEARQKVDSQNRIAALAALKAKKMAEGALSQRADSLSQLEEVYGKIEQAADQVAMVRVMEASTGILRSLQRETGGADRVQDVVEQLREETSKVEEIGDILQSTSEGNEVADDGEVEEELANMLQEAKARVEGEETVKIQHALAQLEPVGKVSSQKEPGLKPDGEASPTPALAEEVATRLKRVSLDGRQSETEPTDEMHTAQTVPTTET